MIGTVMCQRGLKLWSLERHATVRAVQRAMFMCLLCPTLVLAQAAPEPPYMSTRLNADPNSAAYGAEYRGAIRAKFGDQFEFYGGEKKTGYSIALAPMFELHEPRKSHNVLPSQYWRARLSLVQGYGWLWRDLRVRIAALLSHESDHETAHAYSHPGFVALNDLTVRALVAGRQRSLAWYASADAQLYFLSCTLPNRKCENFHGDTSFGGQAQAGLALPSLRFLRFSPYAAASYTGIVAHGRVHPERRLLARLGAYAQFGDSLVSLFVLGSVGNDLGIVRNRTVNVVGGGVGFTR